MERIQIPWEDFIGAAYRHWRTIAATVVIAVVVMSFQAWTTPPLYESKATLLVRDNRAHTALSPDAASEPSRSSIGEDDLTSQAAMLDNPALLAEVLEPYRERIEAKDEPTIVSRVVDAVTFPLWLPGKMYAWWHDSPEPSRFERLVTSLHKHTLITVVSGSNLIEVSYADDDPRWAAKLINKLVARHIEKQTELSQQSVAEKFYDEQSQLLSQRAQDAEIKLRAFYRETGVVAGPEEREALRKRMAEISTALAEAETELAEAEVRVEFLTTAISEHPTRLAVGSGGTNAAGTNSNQVKPRILELSLLRSELLSRYRPDSVKIRDLDKQIASAKRLLEQEQKLIEETSTTPNPTYQKLELELVDARATAATLAGRIDALKLQKDDFTKKSADLAEKAAVLDKLEHDVEQTKNAYRFYDKKREAARFSSALDDSQILNVTVAEKAVPSTNPLPSRGARWIIFGAILGLFGGIVLAYGQDRLDPSVKSASEVGRIAGLAILGEVRREDELRAENATVQVEKAVFGKRLRNVGRTFSAGLRRVRHAMFAGSYRVAGYGIATAVVLIAVLAGTRGLATTTEERQEASTATVQPAAKPADEIAILPAPKGRVLETAPITISSTDEIEEEASQPEQERIVLAAAPAPAPVVEAPAPTEIVIPEGKNLLAVMRDFYGTDDEALVQQVLDANPQLTDPNHIMAGAKLVFPAQPADEGDTRD